MTSEIMPCPFCGGDAGFGRVGHRLEIICNRCGSAGALKADRDDARDAWNTRALAARPAPEAGSVVERLREHDARVGSPIALEAADLIESQAAQIASLSAKVAEVERERDREGLRAEEQWAGWVKADVAKRNAEARASELQREVDRLRAAIDDALGRHQVTHIHAGLRAALQQEGE